MTNATILGYPSSARAATLCAPTSIVFVAVVHARGVPWAVAKGVGGRRVDVVATNEAGAGVGAACVGRTAIAREAVSFAASLGRPAALGCSSLEWQW